MLEILLLTAALVDPHYDSDCPERVAALLERPATVLTSRDVASRLFGEAAFEAVEVVPTPHSERHLSVRYRLEFDVARVVFTQPAAGGAEQLMELDLFAARRELPLPVAWGAREEELRASLGEPARVELPAATERRLVYACDGVGGESSLAFRFADGALTAVEWRLSPD